MTCAIFRKLGNTPTVNYLLNKLETIGDKRDLIDLIKFVEQVEISELLFFKDVIILSSFFRGLRGKIKWFLYRNIMQII